MARLAFVSPLPPAPTGIADYSVEVLELLALRHQIDAFHAQDAVDAARLPAGVGSFRAETLLERQRERPYDLVLYQLGNGTAHAFEYDLLARLPGLLVLHDLVLHHARARAFVDSPEARAYAADPSSATLREAALRRLAEYSDELAYTYPAQAGRLYPVALGSSGELLPYAYPLFRIPVEASRATAAHNAFTCDALRAEVGGARVERVVMPAERVAVEPNAVAALRARLGIGAQELAVGCFGLLTPEKRVVTAAQAVARGIEAGLPLRLLLVGPVPDAAALERQLARLGVRERTIPTGRVPFAELPAHVEAADVVVHLRHPSARETSAALLRVLAQGRPAVVADLEHLAEIPEGCVLRADMADEEGEVTRAVERLAKSPALRASLAGAARAFVAREHSPERCLESYERAIALAREAPPPAPRAWPRHWPRPDRLDASS
ncbi:MAG: glycosyltransferase family 4 protein [Vicinamibacteria bacterium]